MSAKDFDLEPLTEIVGIGIGKAAEVLNTMLSSHVRLSVPSLVLAEPEELEGLLFFRGEESLSAVEMGFSGDFEGSAQLVFASRDAGKLVDCLTNDLPAPEGDLDSIRAGTLCEIGNIVINALIGTVVNLLRAQLSYTVPLYSEGSLGDLLGRLTRDAEIILVVRTRFEIEHFSIDGDLLVFLSLSAFTKLEGAVGRYVAG